MHCASVAPRHIIPGGYEARVNRPHLSLRNCQFDAVVLPACRAIRHVHRGTGCDGLRARPREARASLARATRSRFVFGVCLVSASQGCVWHQHGELVATTHDVVHGIPCTGFAFTALRLCLGPTCMHVGSSLRLGILLFRSHCVHA